MSLTSGDYSYSTHVYSWCLSTAVCILQLYIVVSDGESVFDVREGKNNSEMISMSCIQSFVHGSLLFGRSCVYVSKTWTPHG